MRRLAFYICFCTDKVFISGYSLLYDFFFCVGLYDEFC